MCTLYVTWSNTHHHPNLSMQGCTQRQMPSKRVIFVNHKTPESEGSSPVEVSFNEHQYPDNTVMSSKVSNALLLKGPGLSFTCCHQAQLAPGVHILQCNLLDVHALTQCSFTCMHVRMYEIELVWKLIGLQTKWFTVWLNLYLFHPSPLNAYQIINSVLIHVPTVYYYKHLIPTVYYYRNVP